jgi:hypothetical protein
LSVAFGEKTFFVMVLDEFFADLHSLFYVHLFVDRKKTFEKDRLADFLLLNILITNHTEVFCENLDFVVNLTFSRAVCRSKNFNVACNYILKLRN